eukprot:1137043-Pelagomonas_calceolata.AAC.9
MPPMLCMPEHAYTCMPEHAYTCMPPTLTDVTLDFPCGKWFTPQKPKSLVQTLIPSHVDGKELTQMIWAGMSPRRASERVRLVKAHQRAFF